MKIKHSKWQFLLALFGVLLFIYCIGGLSKSINFSNFFVYEEGALHSHVSIFKSLSNKVDSVTQQALVVDDIMAAHRTPLMLTDSTGSPVHHRITSVPNFKDAFPDVNDVQLATAQKLGLHKRVKNRTEADSLKDQLIYIGDSPYYRVEKLNQSVPYLTPRAARLLEQIGRAFMDSCMAKGVGMHQIVVTSVLRTQEDVDRLRKFNANASENSCHFFGTTFDIGYNKYDRINNPTAEEKPTEWGVKLKQILAEVLFDQRKQGTCYIKYEVKKPCFHITAR